MKAQYAQAGYQPPSQGPFHCDGCIHFDTSGACELVDGLIEAEGCCDLYLKGTPQGGQQTAANGPLKVTALKAIRGKTNGSPQPAY